VGCSCWLDLRRCGHRACSLTASCVWEAISKLQTGRHEDLSQ